MTEPTFAKLISYCHESGRSALGMVLESLPNCFEAPVLQHFAELLKGYFENEFKEKELTLDILGSMVVALTDVLSGRALTAEENANLHRTIKEVQKFAVVNATLNMSARPPWMAIECAVCRKPIKLDEGEDGVEMSTAGPVPEGIPTKMHMHKTCLEAVQASTDMAAGRRMAEEIFGRKP